MARRGRPLGAVSAPPTERFVIRIPEPIAAAFDAVAAAEGKSRTELLHEIIRRTAWRAKEV